MELSTIYIIITVVAIISLYFGRKIALQSIDDKIKRDAFNEAKREYIEAFVEKYGEDGEGFSNIIIQKQKEEIIRLIKENNDLRARL